MIINPLRLSLIIQIFVAYLGVSFKSWTNVKNSSITLPNSTSIRNRHFHILNDRYAKIPRIERVSTTELAISVTKTIDHVPNDTEKLDDVPPPGILTTKFRSRRPAGYWLKAKNLIYEIENFWTSKGITSNRIPSYLLLQYFSEGGLIWGIIQWGGVQKLSAMINLPVLPGRWIDALNTSEVQELISAGHLSHDEALAGPNGGAAGLILHGTARYDSVKQLLLAKEARRRVVRAGSLIEGRQRVGYKRRGYWKNFDNFQWELYGFLRLYQSAMKQPMVWLPRKIEFEQAGRADIAQAISKYGGSEVIASSHGLVPYCNWSYFDQYLTLLIELREYIDKHGNYGIMPLLTEMQSNGYHKLIDRIKWHGGAKLLAAKMGMKLLRGNFKPAIETRPKFRSSAYPNMVDLGPFDLNFAIDLMQYIKDQNYMRDLGQTSSAVQRGDAGIHWDSIVAMPFRQDLKLHGKSELISKIEKFGGFECVARRLQLPYEDRNLREVKRMHINTAIQQRGL